MQNKQMPPGDSIIEIDKLKVYFPVLKGIFGTVVGHVKAVDGVSFRVRRGEVFAIVGESGCGKTTIAHALMGLVKKTEGSMKLAIGPFKENGIDWDTSNKKDCALLRRSIQMIFQDPFSSLNPRMTVRTLIEEPLIIHRLGNAKKRHERIVELLDNVGLSKDFINRYPHEFSGGQRQRIGIARALAVSPEIVIADEPVSALDVSIRAQIINLLQDLRQRFNQTLVIISHDLAVVRHMANSIAVMYQGRIMEMGTEAQIFSSPSHPYTKTLLSSIPVVGKGRKQKLAPLADEKPVTEGKAGCPFFPRCDRGNAECLGPDIQLTDIGENHLVACMHL